jgi:NAD(P)-dependent dehydrogenase (short-subunit alcohol dehydrogenase family)
MATPEQPVALVTGAGQGIGRGIALQLAEDGYHVVVNDIVTGTTEQGAEEVKTTIESNGGLASVCQADISSTDDRRSMMEFVDQHFGRLDLLVNNAGVAPKERLDLLEASEQSWDRLMSINLKGPYFLTQLVARRMIDWQDEGAIKQGRIVFISSISAYTSSTGRGDYCVSKAGLSMAVKLFADRLGEHDIPVIEIRPGIISTPMTSAVTEKYDKLIAEGLLPTRRWGEPADVARVVSAIGRGDLDYSTGESIEVGGGFGIRRL